MEEIETRSPGIVKVLIFIFVLVSAGLILWDLSRNVMTERVGEKAIMTSKSARPSPGSHTRSAAPAESGARRY